MEVPQKVNIELYNDPAISLVGDPKIQVTVDLVSGETCFIVHRLSFFYSVISWQKGQGSSPGSSL